MAMTLSGKWVQALLAPISEIVANEQAAPTMMGQRPHPTSTRLCYPPTVLVLYGIYLLCTVALVWTAVAVTRHIVQHRRGNRSHSEHHDESV